MYNKGCTAFLGWKLISQRPHNHCDQSRTAFISQGCFVPIPSWGLSLWASEDGSSLMLTQNYPSYRQSRVLTKGDFKENDSELIAGSEKDTQNRRYILVLGPNYKKDYPFGDFTLVSQDTQNHAKRRETCKSAQAR